MKFGKFEAVVLVIIVTTGVPTLADDYKLFPGVGYYRYDNTKSLTWGQAFLDCKSDGGHLLVINSEEEAAVFRELTAQDAPGIWWVGITDWYIWGQYFDVLGNSFEEIGYEKWVPGQPDGVQVEHCLVAIETAEYHDYACDDWHFWYICEKEL